MSSTATQPHDSFFKHFMSDPMLAGQFLNEHERGRAEGLAEGLAEGEMKAKAEALMRLLENRFGKIRQNIRKRIAAADATTIDSWFDRALNASELRYVFKA